MDNMAYRRRLAQAHQEQVQRAQVQQARESSLRYRILGIFDGTTSYDAAAEALRKLFTKSGRLINLIDQLDRAIDRYHEKVASDELMARQQLCTAVTEMLDEYEI